MTEETGSTRTALPLTRSHILPSGKLIKEHPSLPAAKLLWAAAFTSAPHLPFSQCPSLVPTIIGISFSLLGVSGALPLRTDLTLSILNIPRELQREAIHTPLV